MHSRNGFLEADYKRTSLKPKLEIKCAAKLYFPYFEVPQTCQNMLSIAIHA